MSRPMLLWQEAQRLVETHGWTLLGLALLLYVARGRYREFSARRHRQRTLAEANDPARVAVLQRETARVRHKQQQQLAKTKQAKVEKAA